MELLNDYFNDDFFIESENKKDNIIISLFKGIMTVIQNVIDSFSLIIKKRATIDDIKQSSYHKYKLNSIEAKIYGKSKTTLDKGILYIDKLLSGVDIPDDVISEFVNETRKSVKTFTDDIKKNGPMKEYMTIIGYRKMNDLLMLTNTKIREKARKLYNKDTDLEKSINRKTTKVIACLKSFIGSLNNF